MSRTQHDSSVNVARTLIVRTIRVTQLSVLSEKRPSPCLRSRQDLRRGCSAGTRLSSSASRGSRREGSGDRCHPARVLVHSGRRPSRAACPVNEEVKAHQGYSRACAKSAGLRHSSAESRCSGEKRAAAAVPIPGFNGSFSCPTVLGHQAYSTTVTRWMTDGEVPATS